MLRRELVRVCSECRNSVLVPDFHSIGLDCREGRCCGDYRSDFTVSGKVARMPQFYYEGSEDFLWYYPSFGCDGFEFKRRRECSG